MAASLKCIPIQTAWRTDNRTGDQSRRECSECTACEPRCPPRLAETGQGLGDFLICSSALRFPPVLVSYSFTQPAKEAVQRCVDFDRPRRPISYSPLPAEPGISPVSQDFTFSPVSVPLSEAAVDTVEPLAHIRQNFEIDLWLGDFEVRPAPVSP